MVSLQAVLGNVITPPCPYLCCFGDFLVYLSITSKCVSYVWSAVYFRRSYKLSL